MLKLAIALWLGAGGGAAMPAQEFWQALQPLCGKAFEGRMVEGTEATDQAFGAQRMVMHVMHCSEREIRIPFHVGADRSRTWVLTRDADGVTLRHDHRHEDGTPDAITLYGGRAQATEGRVLDFPADEYTRRLLPAAATNVWTLSVVPGEQFSYALRREAEGRRFRVVFDLAQPLAAPPEPW